MSAKVLVSVSLILGLSSVPAVAAPGRPPQSTVGGIVYMPDGGPAAMARVVLTCVPSQDQGADLPGPNELTTATDKSGRFWFEAVSCAEQKIVAIGADGSRAATLSSGFNQALELRLEKATRVRGMILGPAGKPIAGAAVSATRSESSVVLETSTAKTAKDGSFELGEITSGVWKLGVSERTGHHATLTLTVPASGVVSPVRLQLPPAGTVTGWVAGLSRADAADVEVFVDGALSVHELGPDARFRIDGVTLGSHEVRAARRSTGDRTAPVRVALGRDGQVTDIELEFPNLPSLSGVARTGSVGAPGLEVEIDGRSRHSTTTDSDGRWSFDDLEPGDYSVAFLDPSDNTLARQEVSLTESTTLDTELDPCELAGTVHNADGTPLPRATVWVGPAMTFERIESAQTGWDGGFRFERLPPGRYSLVATLGEVESDRTLVEVADRVTRSDLQLDAGPGLNLLVFEPSGEPARRITVRPVAHERGYTPLDVDCDRDGLCSTDSLDPDVYDLLVEGREGAAALRTGLPSGFVPVQLVPQGTLRIQLGRDSQRWPYQLLVRTEDGIVMHPGILLGAAFPQRYLNVVTMQVPQGGYVVEVRSADGDSRTAHVHVPAHRIVSVMVGTFALITGPPS